MEDNMKQYILEEAVKFDLTGQEMTLVNQATGFVAVGNKHSFRVLEIFNEPMTESELIQKLGKEYDETQFERINKSVPKIIEWALTRQLIRVVQ